MQRETIDPGRLLDRELAEVDPSLGLIVGFEEDRQVRKLVMIASESICPRAVRDALGSVFTNIYAEGYPARRMLQLEERLLADIPLQLAHHRRYGDRRYYKGTEFVNFVESLARRRVAELFATDRDPNAEVRVRPEEIHANVQALSGAAANNAVYAALLEPGDVIMGMDLTHGGHLTHGSPVNRSGRYYRVNAYGVNPETGKIDYDALEATAREVNPKLIVAGASAFPWDVDWGRLRRIADGLPDPALVMADISHPAGLVVAGLFPNPIGYADVVTFTTHKTMIGPRAAVILTTDRELARRIDRAVFPGEQGGPHVNAIAGVAVALKIAQTPQFRRLQQSIVDNAQALAKGLVARGLKLAYGGTSTHLLLVDLRAIPTASGVPLNGDLASRILDVVGIVCNKNTIIGDASAVYPSGLRLGTIWVTQRGFGPAEMDRIAGLIHLVLTNVQTFEYFGNRGPIPRGRVGQEVLAAAREGVAELVGQTAAAEGPAPTLPAGDPLDQCLLLVRGPRAGAFLQEALAADVLGLEPGQARPSLVYGPQGKLLARVGVGRLAADVVGGDRFLLACPPGTTARLRAWLQDLSDGYVLFDQADLHAKVDGPVAIEAVVGESDLAAAREAVAKALTGDGADLAPSKPYFIGQSNVQTATDAGKREFCFPHYEGPVRRTALYDEHVRLGARMVPFAGWEMPVWYSGIGEEHQAVRKAAGLFDLAHMGVLEVAGSGAGRFLDLVATNHVPALEPGRAQYSYLLDPDGGVVDDILIYRRGPERFALVVNAVNAEKVKAWLDAVNSREYIIDRERPDREVDVRPAIRDLRDPAAGADRLIDLALQGPKSLDILLATVEDQALRRAVRRLARFEFVEGRIDGANVLISRTGYTGEPIGYELCVHPDRAVDLWRLLLDRGRQFGLQPIGLGARDSLRTEAGFPLYGHELAGTYRISPMGAGYGGFVKVHKPFFVGRKPAMAMESGRRAVVVRFRMDERGGRMARAGDPVVDRRGECVGYVTSCTAVEGTQLGLAYVDRAVSAEGTRIGIFPLGASRSSTEKAKRDLAPGDRTALHESATVLSRFR